MSVDGQAFNFCYVAACDGNRVVLDRDDARRAIAAEKLVEALSTIANAYDDVSGGARFVRIAAAALADWQATQ